jgi:alpha-tubulin suppressor-like RCC1 family protein
LALSLLLVGACANHERTPGAPWLLGATILSAAGMPPDRPDFYDAPVRVSESLKFTAITAGADHTCALDARGDTYCWGSSQYRQLGATVPAETCGRLPCSATPVRVQDAPRFTALAASLWGTCGLDVSGAAHCWGYGLAGRQTDGLPASSGAPVRVPGGHAFVALSAAGNRTCGLTRSGEAWCWGLAVDNAAAAGPSVFSGPERIAASSTLVAIGVGGEHGCAIQASLDVACWGSNQFGQLGAGPSALAGGVHESAVPVTAQSGYRLNRIAAAPGYSCGAAIEGGIFCWGLGFPGGANGAGAPDRRSIPHGWLPVPVEGTAGTVWAALSAGTTQACALSADGEIHCFVTTPTRYRVDRRPVRIDSGETFVALAVGGQHACAIGADGFAYCWGLSHMAQAGRQPTGRSVRR